MAEIKRKLEALVPQIDRIVQIGGVPGLSLGVLHNGDILHTAHFGRRNANEAVPPNDDTQHTFASLTKLMTATAIAQLVHEGKLDWDRPIREYLPAFRVRRDKAGMKSTLRDLLSLRTGIAPANVYWGFQNNKLLLDPSDLTATATSIGTAKPFGQFVYSQWNYVLVAEIVKQVIGISIDEYIAQHILQPLGMTRSSFGAVHESETNVAHTHCTHDDGTTSQKPDAGAYILAAGLAAAGGLRGSIRDYLFFAQALLSSYKVQTERDVDSTSDSIIPLARTLFTPHIGMGPPQRSGIEFVAYCLGLYRTRLPGFLSLASPNFYYILGKENLPAYGKKLAGLEIFHHSGTAMGNIGSLFLVPSSQSAVVAFANSQPLMDPTDFVAQLALSVLLDEAPRVNFVKAAELARSVTFQNYKKLERLIAQGKTDTPPRKPLSAYQGDYYNAIHNLVLRVTANDNGLHVTIQDEYTGFALKPYDGDMFYFPVNREEEMCVKGMFGFMYEDWHLFRFKISANNEVESVSWRHDPYLASPEVFTKTPSVQVYARL